MSRISIRRWQITCNMLRIILCCLITGCVVSVSAGIASSSCDGHCCNSCSVVYDVRVRGRSICDILKWGGRGGTTG